ncbi:MAG: phospholipid carrier-dependent glycosyltransferase [Elusimicrobiota bacterium]
MKRYSIFIILIFITFIGLTLRITGLTWGLSTSKYFHAASYYPDESEVLKAYQGINPRKLNFRLNTDTVQIKGTFQPYLMAVWIKLASIFNIVEIYSSFDYYKNNPNELVKLYVTGRSFSVFFGIATIILLFFIGKIFYGNNKIGLLAAFFLAITPLHIIYSHYIVTDILLTFLTTVVLILSYYIYKEASIKIYIITGLLMGLTGATKYSIFPLVIIPILAHILSKNKILDKRLLFYILFIPLGFFIGNPYSILEPQTFLASLKYSKKINITLNPSTNPLDCFGPQNNLIFYLITAPKYSFGIPLSLFFLCGIIFAFIKREKMDILILLWIIIYLLFIGIMSPWKVLRWQMPYIPLLCILSARFIMSVLKNAKKHIRFSMITAVFAVSITTLFYSLAYLKMMTEKDIRDESSEWIEQNIPEGKKIAVTDVYFWNPSIVMTLYWYTETEPFYTGIKKYKIYQTGWGDIEKLNKINSDYVILSDFEYYPILKLKDKYPHPELMPYLEKIMKSDEYKLIKKFEKKPELFGIVSAGGFLPHELRMLNPTILIYKKQTGAGR